MKNILITGGSSGIGETIGREMAKDGDTIFLTGRSETKLVRICEEIRSNGGTAYFGIGDTGVYGDVTNVYHEAISKMGSIDVLILSAGVGAFGILEDLTVEDYNRSFDTNVKGVFLWIRGSLKQMKLRNRGQIIVISSNLGVEVTAKGSLYCATKYAIQGMIGSLRKELEGTNVKAATVNPGSVDTPWFDGKDVDRSKMLSPNDVANAVKLIISQSDTSNIDQVLLKPNR